MPLYSFNNAQSDKPYQVDQKRSDTVRRGGFGEYVKHTFVDTEFEDGEKKHSYFANKCKDLFLIWDQRYGVIFQLNKTQ